MPFNAAFNVNKFIPDSSGRRREPRAAVANADLGKTAGVRMFSSLVSTASLAREHS
jgi:hypothetical protein